MASNIDRDIVAFEVGHAHHRTLLLPSWRTINFCEFVLGLARHQHKSD